MLLFTIIYWRISVCWFSSSFCKWRNRYCAVAKWRSLVLEGNLHTLLRNCFLEHPGFSLHSVAYTMIITRVKLDRKSKRINTIGREWFHVIRETGRILCACCIYLKASVVKQRDDRCREVRVVALLCNAGKSFALYLFALPAVIL